MYLIFQICYIIAFIREFFNIDFFHWQNYNVKNKELAATISDPEKKQSLEKGLPIDFIETFEINQGIYALYCLGRSNNLLNCKNEEDIYIVDIGPIEVRDYLLQLDTNLPEEIVVTPPGDIAYYVREFLS
ncbi:hypothetical protein LCGC14_1210980 [marine sediment metagenome]|uniref:Uncharacterized protein n=1 Tax=marine sediment metagenome TaxID=412755 RepID=A0A0F8VDN6_9ZZZZ